MSIKEIIKKSLKENLSPKQYKQLKELYRHLLSPIYSKNLIKLAALQGTDKWNPHWYAQHYQKHFHHLRKKKLNILEIGVDGYNKTIDSGEYIYQQDKTK